MGKTVYSRNPSTSKGISLFIQSPELQQKISEFITRILTKLLKLSKDLLSQKLNNILRMFLLTEDAFLTLSIMEELDELVKHLSSERHSEDGLKNQSELFLASSTISSPTPMLKI